MLHILTHRRVSAEPIQLADYIILGPIRVIVLSANNIWILLIVAREEVQPNTAQLENSTAIFSESFAIAINQAVVSER